MNTPSQVMPLTTAALYERLLREPLLRHFTLVGGTALSLHIGHRISEDLDFITTLDQLPRTALQKLWQVLEGENHKITAIDNPAAYDDFLNAGMDVQDYSQNWYVDGDVKLTFFAADNHHKSILGTSGGAEEFSIASLGEIAQMKALVAASRSKSRDWVDLFILERDHHFGLQDWRNTFDRVGLGELQFEIALKRITSGLLREDDEGYHLLMENSPTLEEIRDRFRYLRDEYEQATASSALLDENLT